ncbi:MAG TPA: DUF3775 domain-containing protein [Bradyrhizobium sp.]|nr:DUF3775 domain-containing protein [Bradyrhizobium sp.]
MRTVISRTGANCARAAQAHNQHTASYLIGTPMLADYLEEAMERFGKSSKEFEEQL